MPENNSLKSLASNGFAVAAGAALGSAIANKVSENPVASVTAAIAGAALGLYNNNQSRKAGYSQAAEVASEAIGGAALVAYGMGRDIERQRSARVSAERQEEAFTAGQLDATLQIAESLSQSPANRREQREELINNELPDFLRASAQAPANRREQQQDQIENQLPAFLRRNDANLDANPREQQQRGNEEVPEFLRRTARTSNVGVDSNDNNSRTFAEEVLRQRGQESQRAAASANNNGSREENGVPNEQTAKITPASSRSSLEKLRGRTDPDSPMSEQNFRPLEADEPDQPRPATPPVEELSTEGPDKGKFVRSLSSGSVDSSISR